jgi:hypothetical protein
LPLGVSGSHPPSVNANSGGFTVTRDPGAAAIAMDPAYSIQMGGALQCGLLHNGDVYSKAGTPYNAQPLQEAGDVGLTTGSLVTFSALASALTQHINKTSHKNPHGLACGDLGAATTQSVADAVTASEAFATTAANNAMSIAETFATAAANNALTQAESYADSKFVEANSSGTYSFSIGPFQIVMGSTVINSNSAPGVSVNFAPYKFNTTCVWVGGSSISPKGFDPAWFVLSGVPATTGFSAYLANISGSRQVLWVAIGY